MHACMCVRVCARALVFGREYSFYACVCAPPPPPLYRYIDMGGGRLIEEGRLLEEGR